MNGSKPLEKGETVRINPSPVNAPQQPAPEPMVRETVVVPPQGPVPKTSVGTFIPQGKPQESESPSLRNNGASSLGKRIRTALMFLILFVLLLGGVWFVWTLIAGEKEVTITYWGLWEEDAIMRPVIAAFEEKHPKIKVSYVKASHREYRARLESAINRQDGPDVFRFHNTWVAMLREELSTVPEEIMTVNEFTATFYPVAASNLVARDSIYGLPLMFDGLGLYINEEIFSSNNAVPPTTWEEMQNLIPILTQRSDKTIVQSAIALGTTNNVENWSDILALLFLQNGADLIRPTSEQAEQALIFYRKFADPNDDYYTWNETLDNSIYAFTSGRVAMIFAPSWRAFEIHENNKSLKFRIVPVPQLPEGDATWASYWVEGVSAKSPYQKQAWEFVKYITSQEGASKLFTEESKIRLFGEPYARKDLADSLKDDPYLGAYIAQANHAKSFPLASRTFDDGINDKMIKYLENAVNAYSKGTSPTAALATAAEGFSQVLATYGLVSRSAPDTTQ